MPLPGLDLSSADGSSAFNICRKLRAPSSLGVADVCFLDPGDPGRGGIPDSDGCVDERGVVGGGSCGGGVPCFTLLPSGSAVERGDIGGASFGGGGVPCLTLFASGSATERGDVGGASFGGGGPFFMMSPSPTACLRGVVGASAR